MNNIDICFCIHNYDAIISMGCTLAKSLAEVGTFRAGVVPHPAEDTSTMEVEAVRKSQFSGREQRPLRARRAEPSTMGAELSRPKVMSKMAVEAASNLSWSRPEAETNMPALKNNPSSNTPEVTSKQAPKNTRAEVAVANSQSSAEVVRSTSGLIEGGSWNMTELGQEERSNLTEDRMAVLDML